MANLRNIFAASLAISLALVPLTLQPTHAAEIKLLAATLVEIVLRESGSEFEHATGHKINLSEDLAVNFKRKIQGGESFDVAAFAATTIDELIKEGKVRADTRISIMSADIGVAVRKGAPKPDISTVDAFKKALLNAKSVAYLRDGPSGVYIQSILPKLGIAEQIKAKAKAAEMDVVSKMIANGEAEIGIVIIPNIMNVPGAEVVGPLPAEIQSPIRFAGGLSLASKQSDAGKQLLQFLKGPRAIEVMKRWKMTPG